MAGKAVSIKTCFLFPQSTWLNLLLGVAPQLGLTWEMWVVVLHTASRPAQKGSHTLLTCSFRGRSRHPGEEPGCLNDCVEGCYRPAPWHWA